LQQSEGMGKIRSYRIYRARGAMKRTYEKPIVVKAQVRLQAVTASKMTLIINGSNDSSNGS
jgi:hypothetical protein